MNFKNREERGMAVAFKRVKQAQAADDPRGNKVTPRIDPLHNVTGSGAQTAIAGVREPMYNVTGGGAQAAIERVKPVPAKPMPAKRRHPGSNK